MIELKKSDNMAVVMEWDSQEGDGVNKVYWDNKWADELKAGEWEVQWWFGEQDAGSE